VEVVEAELGQLWSGEVERVLFGEDVAGLGGGLQVDAVLADGTVKGHWFLATGAYKTAGLWFGTGATV
jgi:hypothetical protein